MKTLSSGLKACGIAMVLACAMPAPAAMAQTAPAASTPDFAVFRTAADRLKLFEFIKTFLLTSLRSGDALSALTPAQRDTFIKVAGQELDYRRTAIMDAILGGGVTAFSHAEINRLPASCGTQGDARISTARSRVQVWALATDEAAGMARHAATLLGAA